MKPLIPLVTAAIWLISKGGSAANAITDSGSVSDLVAEAAAESGSDGGTPIVREGKAIEFGVRPDAKLWASACSFWHPICVHSTSTKSLILAVGDAERAWDLATGPLALPPPDVAIDTGVLDIYLDRTTSIEDTLMLERDPRGGYDRVSTFIRVDDRLDGCSLEAAITRQLLAAILYRVAPATDRGTALGTTDALARLMTPCVLTSDTASVGTVQSHPELAVIEPSCSAWSYENVRTSFFQPRSCDLTARGSSLFFGWIDDAFATTPGASIIALWALTPTRTPHDAIHWYAEPDSFDVLRTSFKGALSERSTLDDLLVDYGVARAFMGSAADETHFLESRSFGDAAKIAIAWDLPWPEKPRRVASPLGVAPTGSSYVLIHHDLATKGSRLRIESEWEELMRLRWVAVKLDARGKEIARIPIATGDKDTHAQMTVGELDDCATILLVATNVGTYGTADNAFDPDEGPWEPHGYMLTIASE